MTGTKRRCIAMKTVERERGGAMAAVKVAAVKVAVAMVGAATEEAMVEVATAEVATVEAKGKEAMVAVVDGHVAVSTAEARAEVATEEGLAGAAETATGGSAMVRVVVKEKEEKAVAARVAKARGRW